MAPPKKRALPKPLPVGFILTDTEKNKWKLGKIIGEGGFGLIYLASKHVDRPVAADTDYVIKVEYQENGPLFSELKFYQRAAKLESMQKWKRSRKLDFLGIPTYWGSGLAEYNNLRYRFMAMDRLGSDLQKICDSNGGRLKKSTVLQLGQGLVTVLEYIHENEYVHADIKAANLMLGYRDQEQVYLADYGLSYRYCPDGVHKEYKENPKKGHNGTIEYTSLDAHKGLAPSRRGDLQILGFCLLQWLCGSLPWDNVLKNPNLVQEAKARLMDNLPDSVQQLSVSGASTDEVATFLLYVKTLGYQDNPDYQYLKTVLASVVTGRLDFSKPQVTPGKSITKAQDPTTSVQDLTTKAQDPTTSVQDLTTKIQDLTTRQKEAGRARGPPKAKAAASAVTDEPKKEKMMSKPVLPQYIKGPPLTKPQSQQKEDGVLPAVSRSLRPRPELAISYKEYDSEDEDEDEEETARPTPIPARYVRSPPIGPRAEPKQKTKSKWTCRKTDILTVNSERQEDRLDQRRRKRIPINCDGEDPTHMEHRSRWDEGLPRQAAGHSDLCHDNRDSLSEWEGSALRGLEREAGLTERNERFSWFVCVGVFLFLGAVLGVCQSAF